MKLVVDANVLFSFFKSDSVTRELITSFEFLELYTPAICVEELSKHKREICEKCGISEGKFRETLEDLKLFVKVVPEETFREYGKEAAGLLPEHPKDAPYLALALKLSCAVWSIDSRLKRQTRVGVFSTAELIKRLGS